ncbi:hypothetical protein OG607_24800 [Streptomyces sp. NBC_01537]|uniref:hypothetical protein n=1 Tax=Streptomyces sp. NBC_01537 TaxID=2903896 RepID=UPI0038692CF4
MSENNGAQEAAEQIRTGDVSGTVVVGDNNTVNNLTINTGSGSTFNLHTGPLPDPVKRQSISQLPRPAAEPLTGRARDVRALQGAIEAHQLVQVWGASGVGKSALLRHLACTMPRGPEGAAYIEAGGRTADDIAQAIFDISFDAPNYKPSLEVLKEHLKTLRLRIYLDDAGLDEKDLRRLFDMAGQSTFVFTSQQRSAVDGVHAIRLEGLSAPAAAELVAALLPRELRPDEARIVPALCDAVDGNPLRLRRIALSAATGKGLPGIADLPELLPALLNKLRPQERDLLHLLGSLSGAELAARHLNDLLGRPDIDTIAGGLVRHGLLLASETGYSCPPDVAESVLNSRKTEFPADGLCRALTTWVEARDTTPDDVAAHFQALDVAVLRAERSGHAQLGAALARAASPKLALSRQFDAWGSLLGVGWAAARSAGDKEGEEFFLNEARTRRRAIGRAAQTTALALEAGVLWHELTALHTQSAAHQVANAASAGTSTVHQVANAAATSTPPVHPFTPTPGAVHTPAFTHPAAATSAPSASAHAARPVFDLSQASAQPHAAAHMTGAHSAAPIPQKIDLSAAHSSAPHSTHAVSATTPAASTGHTALTATGTATVKGGVSALALACAIGAVAVLGVGAAVYANDRPDSSPVVASSSVSTPDLSDDTDTEPDLSEDTAPTVDPVCATVIPDLSSELQQFSTDTATASDAIDSYNTDMYAYNSGQTSTVPDDSTVLSDVGTVISDLESVESTLQGAVAQAQDSSVASDLGDMLTATQQLESLYQSYMNDPENSEVDPSSQALAMNSASDSLLTDCDA